MDVAVIAARRLRSSVLTSIRSTASSPALSRSVEK